jgi:choline kinase
LKVIILAAGTGTRLMPLTKDIPKPLLLIGNMSLLEHMIKNCVSNNIKEFIIVIGHKKERVIEETGYLREKYDIKIDLVENKDYSITNTSCSVNIAINHLNEDIIIINGDNVIDQRIISGLVNNDKTCLVIDNYKKLNYESFKIKIENNIISEIGKELDIKTASGEFIGISKVSKNDLPIFKSILKRLISVNVQNYYDLTFKELSEKVDINYFYTNGLKWTEIDDKSDWEYANSLIEEFDRI